MLSIDRMIKALEKINNWKCEDLPCRECPLKILRVETGADHCIEAVDNIINALREVK